MISSRDVTPPYGCAEGAPAECGITLTVDAGGARASTGTRLWVSLTGIGRRGPRAQPGQHARSDAMTTAGVWPTDDTSRKPAEHE